MAQTTPVFIVAAFHLPPRPYFIDYKICNKILLSIIIYDENFKKHVPMAQTTPDVWARFRCSRLPSPSPSRIS